MNARTHIRGLLGPATCGAAVSLVSVALAARGVHIAALAASSGVIGALLLRPLIARLSVANARIEGLEGESLEHRRALYRLKKDDQVRSQRQLPAPRQNPIDETALAAAVHAIASELNEARLIESIVKTFVETLGVTRVSLHAHDRSADRFLRGVGAERSDGSIAIRERAVTAEDEAVLRLALKRRAVLEHAAPEPDVRAAFETATKELAVAVPLFDRALVTNVILIFGAPQSRSAVEVLAATASLALSATYLRSERTDRERALEPRTATAASSTKESNHHAKS